MSQDLVLIVLFVQLFLFGIVFILCKVANWVTQMHNQKLVNAAVLRKHKSSTRLLTFKQLLTLNWNAVHCLVENCSQC